MRRDTLTGKQALSFVKEQGVILVSGKGPVPRLIEAIAGERITGSWWAHSKSHEIFTVLQTVVESKDILVCRLIDNKITLVHRRLWPALVKLAQRFPRKQLARVKQEHTASGRHINRETPFPEWVPPVVFSKAKILSEEAAHTALGSWLKVPEKSSAREPRKSHRGK